MSKIKCRNFFFFFYLTGKPDVPRSKPRYMEPDFDSMNLDTLEQKIRKVSSLFSDQVHGSQLAWWTQYIKELQETSKTARKKAAYMAKNVEWDLFKMPKYNAAPLGINMEEAMACAEDPDLQGMMDAEVAEPEVRRMCSVTK